MTPGSRVPISTSPTGITVVVVGRDSLIRQGVVSALRESRPHWRLRLYESGISHSQRGPTDRPDLVVSTSPADGQGMLPVILSAREKAPTLFVATPNIVDAATRLAAGLIGGGARALDAKPHEFAHSLELPLRVTGAPRPFTGRQLDLIAMLISGQTTAQMAHSLRITESTVKTHLGRLARRFGAGGRSGLQVVCGRLLLGDDWRTHLASIQVADLLSEAVAIRRY